MAEERSDLVERLKGFMPSRLAERILAAQPREGELRPVTVLFADLSGFTALGQRLPPEELAALTNECLETMARVVFKYEGYVDKFIGDAVMALFGAPVAHEDDPERALRCALEMREAIRALPHDLDLHIGVHSGEVIAGTVGTDLRMEYTVLGDAVNLAARLEESALPGQVLVSQTTYHRTQPLFEFKGPVYLPLQGLAEPVAVFELQRTLPGLERMRGIEGLTSPLVGREKELAMVGEALDELVRGRGQILMVMGEPGIGKTRLVEEARHYAREQYPQGLRWLVGRSLSYGQALSYWPLREILRSWAAIVEEDAEAKAFGKLRVSLRRLFPDRPEEILPYLAALLGLRLEGPLEERVRYLTPEALNAQILLGLSSWIEALAREKPLILYFDDFHWADNSTSTLLEQLLAITDRAPVALVFAMRTEREAPGWRLKGRAENDFSHRYREVRLEPLSEEESERLVTNLLQDLPASMRRIILQKTEGNPFFVEEVIRGLIEERVLVRRGEQWAVAARVLDTVIPETVQGVLLARIDRLDPSPKRTLQMASVIGRSFLYRLLEAVVEGDGELQDNLTALQRADLLREVSRIPEAEYIFKNALAQEVAYGTLLSERRKLIHRKVAEAIEQLYPDRLTEFTSTLAHHYGQAGIADKAVHYSLLAGEQAAGLYANEEAISHYDRAVTLLEALGDQRGLALALEKKGDVYFFQRLMVKAYETYDRAIEIWRSLGDPDPRALIRLYRKIGIGVGRWAGRHKRADEYLAQALALLEKAPDDLERARVLSALSFRKIISFYGEPGWAPDYKKGRVYAEEAVAIAERLEAWPDLSEAYDALSVSYWGMRDLQQFRQFPVKRLSILERIQNPFEMLDAHLMVSWSSRDAGDFVTAQKHAQIGLAISQQVGSLQGQWQAYIELCRSYSLSGKWDEALEMANRGLELCTLLDDPWYTGNFLLTHYLILALRGRFGESKAFREKLDEPWATGQNRRWGVYSDAEVSSMLNDWEKAVSSLRIAQSTPGVWPPDNLIFTRLAEALTEAGQLEEAEEIAASLDVGELPNMWLPAGVILHRARGTIQLQRGAWKEAEAAYKKALEILKTTTMPLEKARTLQQLGRMYLKRGELDDVERARAVLREAKQIYESLGAKPLIEQVDDLLAKAEP